MLTTKHSYFFLAALVLLVALIALLTPQSAGAGKSGEGSRADSSITVDQAQALIAKGEALDTIPRKVWQQILSPQQFDVMWNSATERPNTGALLHEKRKGVFVSAGCKIPVFKSEHKFESGTGWPSFWEVFDKNNVILKEDRSWGMRRTEVLSKCGEHLGHVFDDGPKPTRLRYCINSAALAFIPEGSSQETAE